MSVYIDRLPDGKRQIPLPGARPLTNGRHAPSNGGSPTTNGRHSVDNGDGLNKPFSLPALPVNQVKVKAFKGWRVQVATLSNHVRDHLPAGDPRREKLLQLIQTIEASDQAARRCIVEFLRTMAALDDA